MAENKRFYWLKLQTDFFRQKEIKKLRAIAGGDTYTVIYLKMLLSALESGGKLYYEGIDDDFESELALSLDEEVENVKVTVAFLLRTGLMVSSEDRDVYELEKLNTMIGSESSSAERVRRFRDKQKEQKALHCNTEVTKMSRLGNVEKEIEREKEIEIERDIEEEGTERSRTDYQKIVALYHSICKSYPEIKALSENRKKAIRARLKTYSIEDIETVFRKAEASDFMKGKNNRNWSATFDWMMKDANFAKIIEGNYDNKEQQYTQSQAQPQSGFNSNDYLLNIINGSEAQG